MDRVLLCFFGELVIPLAANDVTAKHVFSGHKVVPSRGPHLSGLPSRKKERMGREGGGEIRRGLSKIVCRGESSGSSRSANLLNRRNRDKASLTLCLWSDVKIKGSRRVSQG